LRDRSIFVGAITWHSIPAFFNSSFKMNPFPDASYATAILAPPACSLRRFSSSINLRRPAWLAENVVLSDFSRLCAIRVTSVLSCESHPTKIKLLVKASSPSCVMD
jgi:hypothetical protein